MAYKQYFIIATAVAICCVIFCDAVTPPHLCGNPPSAPVALSVSYMLPCSNENAPCKVKTSNYDVTGLLTVNTPESHIGRLRGMAKINMHSHGATLQIMDKDMKNEIEPNDVPENQTIHIRADASYSTVNANKGEYCKIQVQILADDQPYWCIEIDCVVG